jgi:hypothetical protein
MCEETLNDVINLINVKIERCNNLLNGEIDEDYDTADICGRRDALEELHDILVVWTIAL